MKKLLVPATLLVLPLLALADVGLKNQGSTVGPVKDINCSTGMTCSRSGAVGSITVATEPLTASSPLTFYDDGGVVNLSMTAASATSSGYVSNVSGRLVVDAGFTSTMDIVGSNVSASSTTAQFNCTSTSGTCQIRSSISAASATSSNAAFQFRPVNTLDANDSLFFISGATAGHPGVFQLDNEGDTVIAGTVQGAGFYPTGGVIESTSTTQPLSLTSDMNASTATASVPAARICAGAVLDALDLVFAVGNPGGCTTEVFSIDNTGSVLTTSALTKGSKTLVAGSGTVTVLSGAKCVCSEETNQANGVKCSVSGTTLTITGTGTDVITYVCL